MVAKNALFTVKHKDEINHPLWKRLSYEVVDIRSFPEIGRTEFLISSSRGFRWVNSIYYIKV